ncbi:amidohydrolase family protein [Marinoscillum sp. 108]|uniref:amidohydrolase family protein n=1 Tax=Marinoscillum sp. 108 TaxID=2653151 RepID=UPI0012F129DC|nr:amidohydrolase family protein [Marinoscillum sp. 108]VXD10503.1 Amidohydrolase [Marinoscillum sp. 108]
MKKLILLCLALAFHGIYAQETFPVNGVPDERSGHYAFTNATIFVDYQTKLENATLIIKDGKVTAVGTGISIPKGAITVNLEGKYIYPALVDPYSNYGLPEVFTSRSRGKPQYESSNKGPYGWNDAIRSTYNASEEFALNEKEAEGLRKAGFGAVNTFSPDGIMRGTSLFTNLSDAPVQDAVLSDKVAAHYSFSKGTSKQEYPGSIMGVVALLRQTYYDAAWYRTQGSAEQVNLSLKAFNDVQRLPQVFEANGGKLRVLLADQVGDEFGVQYIIKGTGDEYQRISEIKKTGASLIIPVTYPEAYDVEDPMAALDVSLEDMKHWELAPINASMLAKAGVEFSFTPSGLKNTDDYWKNIRKAVTYGLSETQALKALTYTPARYFNMQQRVGGLKQGMMANFFVASESIFEEKAKIHQTWVQGRKYEISDLSTPDYAGKYNLKVGDTSYALEISGEAGSHSAKVVVNDSTDLKVKLKIEENRVTLIFKLEEEEANTRLTGWVDPGAFGGTGQLADGSWTKWSAARVGDLDEKEADKDAEDKEEEEDQTPDLGKMIYPFVAYGWTEQPVQETILFKNATVWTLEGDGKLEGADVLVKAGKIASVGKGLAGEGAKVVDATGKHITPGIIDEHSHIALSSVNEGSHAITAEVRMYDALNSEDVNLYRQLAGGVTAAQLLHGSANPVGGQSALIKFRWGASPEGLKIKGADGYIKFALGENVKQSNWGADYSIRFPQTRMGVEQVFVDGFTRAKAYGEAKARYEGLSKKMKASTPAPRKDLQLETLLEIINSERFITCHSYVQSEINMLLKVAESFDFRINTFTHILEGYKVADKMAEHGAGGSTFSDWWAYKFEVKDAIPYNASLMTMAGVVAAINSDDAEMARRLNQEAAKSVKYGGMDEISALKLVTLNPAKLLHLDDRMGSIKVGKDADVVLWNDHPLSIYAKPEMTLVDGVVYFSLEKDAEMRKQISAERARLIQKMLDAKNGGEKTQKPKKKDKHYFECEDIIEEGFTLNHQDND